MYLERESDFKSEKSFIEHYIHCGMLSTYSVLMMLILGTGSLVGIGSMYTPANVETQPEQVKPLVPRVQPEQVKPLVPRVQQQPLTGIWKGSDQGTYYVRQVGDDIMWIGMSANDGRSWTNAFAGKRAGDTISGTWADVPREGTQFAGSGTLTLKVSQVGAKISMQKVGSTGSGFSGTSWQKQ
jgi:hypothetical protein